MVGQRTGEIAWSELTEMLGAVVVFCVSLVSADMFGTEGRSKITDLIPHAQYVPLARCASCGFGVKLGAAGWDRQTTCSMGSSGLLRSVASVSLSGGARWKVNGV